MTDLRAAFSGHVIRRTKNTKDLNGNPIVDLPPFNEHLLKVKLFATEYKILEERAANQKHSVVSII